MIDKRILGNTITVIGRNLIVIWLKLFISTNIIFERCPGNRIRLSPSRPRGAIMVPLFLCTVWLFESITIAPEPSLSYNQQQLKEYVPVYSQSYFSYQTIAKLHFSKEQIYQPIIAWRRGFNFKSTIFKGAVIFNLVSIPSNTALMWMTQDPTHDYQHWFS